jgi:DNA-directed RNA polymerase specialized sigma24 family protein
MEQIMSNEETTEENNISGVARAGKPHYMPTHTRWTVLEEARAGSEAALDEFFQIYWPPVYAYFRAKGLQEADAKDRTQGFFLRWIQSNTFASLSQERGSFSRYLLACLKHHHINEFIKERRKHNLPSGGLVSWNDVIERENSHYEPSADQTPDQAFELACQRRLIMTAFNKMLDCASEEGSSHKVNCEVFYRRCVEPMLDGGPKPSLEMLAKDFSLTVKQVRLRLDKTLELFRKHLVDELVPEGGSTTEAEQKAKEILFPDES